MTPALGPAQPARRARCTGPLVRRPGAVGRPGSSVDVASAQRLYRALQADAGVTPLEMGWISTHSTAKELILDLLELSDDLDLLDFVDSDGNLVDSDNLERYLSRLQSLVAQTDESTRTQAIFFQP